MDIYYCPGHLKKTQFQTVYYIFIIHVQHGSKLLQT